MFGCKLLRTYLSLTVKLTHSLCHSLTVTLDHSLSVALTRTLHSTAATVSPKVPTEPKDRDTEETASGSEDDAS